MNADICDGCMNGCSLSQPGCPRGEAKATGNPVPVMTTKQAQGEYLCLQNRIQNNQKLLLKLMQQNYDVWKENHVDSVTALLPELAGSARPLCHVKRKDHINYTGTSGKPAPFDRLTQEEC